MYMGVPDGMELEYDVPLEKMLILTQITTTNGSS
jgi:hypothetical protein